MKAFPRTTVGGVSLPRLIIGTNWFCGFSHTTRAKDALIADHMTAKPGRVADIMEVFFRAGVNAVMGLGERAPLPAAIQETEDRTGMKAILISTPTLPFDARTPAAGFDLGEVERIVEQHAKLGATFFMPHQGVTDAMVDRCLRRVRHMEPVCKLIRQYGMVPGLSTHMPETIVYADESGLDVESYVSLYNAMGFLMQVEVDWVAAIMRAAKKPVMTIKPLASGQLRPFQALNFVWNTLRPQDMVTIGTLHPSEAAEVIELSFAILDRREAEVGLQETRSKASVKRDPGRP
jgi:hypothetical protein